MSGQAAGDASIVVPATDAPSSTSIVRSLGRRGIHTIAVSEQATPPAFWSRYCGETAAVPPPDEDLGGYRDALLSFARRPDVGTIAPVREVDVYVLARDREAFAAHVGTPWPALATLREVHDRERLFDAAERAGVPVPATRPLDEVDDWGREQIVKGRFAMLAAEYVDGISPDRYRSPPKTLFVEPGAAPDTDAIVDAMGHVPIVQEFVAGTEYCLRALYDHGEPVATSQKRLVRGYKYSRGPSIYHEAVDIQRLEDIGLALLDELDWHGLASVGFIRDGTGEFKLLEVNPRFPASLPVDVQAGADYPCYYWQLATGGADRIARSYRPGTATHLLRGELVHLHSVVAERYPLVERPSPARTACQVATSLLAHPRFDLLSLDDPGPFVRDTSNAVRELLPR